MVAADNDKLYFEKPMKNHVSVWIKKFLARKVYGRLIGRARLTSAEQKFLISAAALFLLGALVRFYRSRPMPMTAQETALSREAHSK